MKFVLANLGRITKTLVRVVGKQDDTSRRRNLLSATLNGNCVGTTACGLSFPLSTLIGRPKIMKISKESMTLIWADIFSG